MPEPTDKQRAVLSKLRMTYGKDTVTEHAADRHTGYMRVDLKCEAGTWYWIYDRDGRYVFGTLTQRLFTPEPPPHKPGNALDN